MYLNLSLPLTHGSIVGVGSTHLEEIGLEVSAHRSSGNADHQGREGVKTATITCKLRGTTARGFQGGDGYRGKPTSQATRFKTHPNQACKPKHDGNTYVLNLLVRIRVARVRAKALHPRIGYPVKENHKRFDKFCGDMLARGRAVPPPPQFGE